MDKEKQRNNTKTTSIGRLLRTVREARGLTQGQLASKAGITQSAISQIESGTRPNPNLLTIHMLERALGEPKVYLAYDAVAPEHLQISLSRFLESHLAKELQITPEEIDDLKNCIWYGAHEQPDEKAWYDFVCLRRRVRSQPG